MIPVTVLGGYLGAGKTTLLNHLLREAGGLRLAVLVNDFGVINIDADLIESRDGDVLNLAGGCVCCSFGSDLVGALIELAQRGPAPDHVLIETSGVALPASVARTVGLASRELGLDAIVVVADAETVRDRAADRYVGETVRMQLADADLIIVSKRDLVDPDAAGSLDDWLRRQAPDARIVHADRGRLPPSIVVGLRDDRHAAGPTRVPVRPSRGEKRRDGLGLFGADAAGGGAAARLRALAGHAENRFVSASFETSEPIPPDRIAAVLVDPELGVIRAKGLLRDLDGQAKRLQLVGVRVEIRESTHPDPAHGRLVCIGLRDRIDPEAIAVRTGLRLVTREATRRNPA